MRIQKLFGKEVTTDGTADPSARFRPGDMTATAGGLSVVSILLITGLILGGLIVLAALVIAVIALVTALKKKS